MSILSGTFRSNPLLARVLPFVLFVALTALQGQFGEASRYWMYLVKTIVGAWLILECLPYVSELKLNFSWEAFVVGFLVCVMWIGLDGFYPGLGSVDSFWNPHAFFGTGSVLAWSFILIRFVGSVLIVPPLEEIFYRSFVYRYLEKSDFLSVSLGQFLWRSFLITALVFGFTHREWLAGILCGFAYQGLVVYKKRLGDAIVAHAFTNLLLGLWVVIRGDWIFW